MEFEGKRALVVGLGVSGLAAARTLHSLGARVAVTEGSEGAAVRERAEILKSLGVTVEIGGHRLDDLDVDLAIVSPGIPPHAPICEALGASGVEMWSEIELASRLARCDLLAVTGTNGKTTTTMLLAAMLDAAGVTSVAAGNIGLPLIQAVDQIPPGGAIAVEVSSFQLALTSDFRPRTATILNIAEDHTDWHGSLKEYADAKGRITANQTPEDTFLPNALDPIAMQIADGTRARVAPFSSFDVPADGIGVDGGRIMWRGSEVLAVERVPLPGPAGLEDVLSAAGSALAYGLDVAAVAKAVVSFRPLGHRLEVVGEHEGVVYIDDSKATNPHAAIAAVTGFRDVVLIAGGRSKGIDLTPLASLADRLLAVIAIGEAATELARIFDATVPVELATDMDEAVVLARKRSIAGGSVLLSPACASLDMYESYAHRGDEFARAVRDLFASEGAGTGVDGEEGAAEGRES